MRKDYHEWNTLKIAANAAGIRLPFNERDIWSCYLGANMGDEEDGAGDDFARPVLIIRKFNSHICWIIPLTRTDKDSEYYFRFSFMREDRSMAILSQLRIIDSFRLVKKIGYINKKDFADLTEKLKALLH